MLALGTGVTKREYVSELGTETISKSSSKSYYNIFPEGSYEHITSHQLKHTSGASWTQQAPSQTRVATVRETFRKKTHKAGRKNACCLDV